MGDKGKGDVPKFPDPSKTYEQGIKIAMKYLPRQLQQELEMRGQYDPAYIEQALGLQHAYDPRLAGEQLAALQRRDPQWLAIHQGLGDKVQQALARGYVDPNQAAAYTALGKQVTGDTLRGTTASPAQLRDITQAILSRSPSLSYGEAQDMAAAVYTGQRGQQLQQQRQQATNQFLGQLSPEMQTYGLAGTYMQPSNSVTGQINQIQGVTPPSANRYVNPNAGYQGQQFALQNYQNALAYNQMGSGQSQNPWMGALQGASSGASMGSIGGPYGMAGGAIIGGVAGGLGYPQFSDERGKNNISRTRTTTKDGIPIVEYDYNGKRWRGVLAQEVEKVRPDAVYHYGNGTLGVFYSRLGIELEEVQ